MADPTTDQTDQTDQTTDDSKLDEEAAAAAAAVALLASLIGDDVEKALATDNEEQRVALLATLAATAFTLAYQHVGGTGSSAEEARAYVFSLRPAFGLLKPDGSDAQQERMVDIISHSAVSAATVAAATDTAGPQGKDDLKFEWRTMRDDRVRDMHRPVDGQIRAAADPFDVGGHQLRYPGQPVGPPEVWINCRCYLIVHGPTVTAAGGEDEMDAVGSEPSLVAVSDKPWSQFSASDYTIEQWRRACILTMPGGDPESKSTYKLPIREPGGALNSNGVHAAASRIGQVDAPASAISAARGRLRGAYKELGEEVPDSLKADAVDDTLLAWPKSTSPPGTHDAPGWLTNPRETQRLRDYWAKGEGAAKIRWGQPGDFDRCRKQLVKYVQNPDHLAGTCANLHFVALGYWPNQGPHAGKHGGKHASLDADACEDCQNFDPENTTPEGAAVTAAFAAAAELDEALPPREWFTDPGLDGPTALTVTDDNEVVGHIGLWDQCHVGFKDACVPPPHSTRDYHHFRTGYVRTAGGNVAVGNLTLGTGHADEGVNATAAVEHYDNTGTAVADVAAGEDAHGIWVHGMIRPGTTPEQIHALRAGTVSGDWRRLGGNLEMVAALVVNVPGFPIPRPTETLAASGEPISLLAAGIVVTDPNALDAERIAVAVIEHLDERQRIAANRSRVAAMRAEVNAGRIERLVAAVGVER